jgi:hypothetical protein
MKSIGKIILPLSLAYLAYRYRPVKIVTKGHKLGMTVLKILESMEVDISKLNFRDIDSEDEERREDLVKSLANIYALVYREVQVYMFSYQITLQNKRLLAKEGMKAKSVKEYDQNQKIHRDSIEQQLNEENKLMNDALLYIAENSELNAKKMTEIMLDLLAKDDDFLSILDEARQ